MAALAARVLAVDETEVRLLVPGRDLVVDALFDGRRIWSFWVRRDTTGRVVRRVSWPEVMRPHLRGTSTVTLREHVSDRVLWEGDLSFGDGADRERRIEFVNKAGLEISLDKAGRFSPTFSVRTQADLDPLLDAMDDVLGALGDEGVAAFPAYGTLLGAVREGQFLGHDSDADLGYVSRHTDPVDVVRESFRLQRAVAARGMDTYRYSGAAFRVRVEEGDGIPRGLDVFGGFLDGGRLYLMGEVGTDYEPEWIHPLGTCELAGRTFPAPARPEKLLEAMYGPSWRVPDPAYQFETSERTKAQLNQWFRGSAYQRREWEREWSLARSTSLPKKGSDLARLVARREDPATHLLDVGAGRGSDALWWARRGRRATAYDFAAVGPRKARRHAESKDLPMEVRPLNLTEWRSVLSEGARVAREPGPRAVVARHLLDATDEFGRQSLGRFASMTLRGGGHLYLEFWTGEGEPDPDLMLRPIAVERARRLVTDHGGTILSVRELDPGAGSDARSFAVGRLVAQWS
ncbi:hypothetical protein GCM10009795_041200 [Nocardioides hankookensis]|uniref:Class I SAM-dependent methyltransferase n=1 Tax=Nocardioides hankookensis TaxID=443157 RepID=A0ABW1LR61_9ACTN